MNKTEKHSVFYFYLNIEHTHKILKHTNRKTGFSIWTLFCGVRVEFILTHVFHVPRDHFFRLYVFSFFFFLFSILDDFVIAWKEV